MPNGNDIIANAADGTQHHFPAGTDMTVVDATMKKYAGDLVTERHERGVSPGVRAQLKTDQGPGLWERTIGEGAKGFEGFSQWMRDTVNEAQQRDLARVAAGGEPGISAPIKTGLGGAVADISGLGGSILKSPKNTALTALAFLGPLGRALAGSIQAGTSIGDVPQTWGTSYGAPPIGTPEGMQNRLLNLAGITGGIAGAAGAPAGVRNFGASARGTVQEVMGEGTSKARLLADQHAHATVTKAHLSDLADAVHGDVQQAESGVLSKIDEAHLNGVSNKVNVQGKIQDAIGDLVKVPEKMPSSIAKILAEEKGGIDTRNINLESGAGKAFKAQLEAQGLMPKENLTAEQLKQMRSDVGMELGRYGSKGVVGAALNRVYGILSDELRGAAKNAGVEKEWLDANAKTNQYNSDFVRGPLRRVLRGTTASDIMDPLTGSNRQVVLDTLQKYKDAGFNVDMDWLQGKMRYYSMGRTVTRLSQPTKMDLLMAGFAPKALAIRQLGPRIMRNPAVLKQLAGTEDVPIPPSKVYPTKAAAMAARRIATGGSGESEASLEAINASKGVQYFLERPGGERVPLSAIDARGGMRLNRGSKIIEVRNGRESTYRE